MLADVLGHGMVITGAFKGARQRAGIAVRYTLGDGRRVSLTLTLTDADPPRLTASRSGAAPGHCGDTEATACSHWRSA